jgi:hypothetical protein
MLLPVVEEAVITYSYFTGDIRVNYIQSLVVPKKMNLISQLRVDKRLALVGQPF